MPWRAGSSANGTGSLSALQVMLHSLNKRAKSSHLHLRNHFSSLHGFAGRSAPGPDVVRPVMSPCFCNVMTDCKDFAQRCGSFLLCSINLTATLRSWMRNLKLTFGNILRSHVSSDSWWRDQLQRAPVFGGDTDIHRSTAGTLQILSLASSSWQQQHHHQECRCDKPALGSWIESSQ